MSTLAKYLAKLFKINNSTTIISNNYTLSDSMDSLWISNKGTPSEITKNIQRALDTAKGRTIVLSGVYRVNKTLVAHKVNIVARDATIITTAEGDGLSVSGVEKPNDYIAKTGYTKGENFIDLKDASNISPGNILRFYSSEELFHPSRSYYYKGGVFIVEKVSGNRVYFLGTLDYNIIKITNVLVYDAGCLKLEGSLRLENSNNLPAGNMGIAVKFCAHSTIEGAIVDNFVNNICIYYSVSTKVKNCETYRSLYKGTSTSYGLLTCSSRDVLYENCKTKSGRHGHAAGGQTPCDTLTFLNCSIFNENNSHYSFDFHDNSINVTIDNCEMDSFTVIGSVIMRNCTVLHKYGSLSSFKSSSLDDANRCNYIFENIYFPNGGELALSGYSQGSGTWTMDQLNTFKATNISADKPLAIKFHAKSQSSSMPIINIKSIILENCTNVGVVVGDNISNLILRNILNLSNINLLYQSTAKIYNILIENCEWRSGYDEFRLTNFNRCLIQNSQMKAGTFPGKIADMVISSQDGVLTLVNCTFNDLIKGVSHKCKNVVCINTEIKLLSSIFDKVMDYID